MARKALSLRQAVLTTTAMVIGSGAGTLTEAAAVQASLGQPGLGQVVTAAVALWTLATLDRLIDDRQ